MREEEAVEGTGDDGMGDEEAVEGTGDDGMGDEEAVEGTGDDNIPMTLLMLIVIFIYKSI